MLIAHKYYTFYFLCLLAALLIGVSVFLPAEDSTARKESYKLISTECSFSVYFEGSIECAYLQLPAPNQKTLLPVTVIKNKRADKRGDPEGRSVTPLLYFSGGPGAGVGVDSESIHHWLGWYELAGLDRDLVLFDRRAVGYSNPKHSCPSYDRFSLDALTKNFTTGEEMRLGISVIQNCFERFSKRAELQNDLGTVVSGEDAGQLMLSLGYSRWHVFGVSYGSRLALVHAGAYSNNVEKIIFDSIYPLGRGVLKEWPHLLDGALKRYFSYCRDTAKCSDGFAMVSPEESFWLAMELLQLKPMQLMLDNWRGGEIELLLNDHRFLSAIFSALYDVNSIEKIAPAIHGVISGDEKSVERLLTPFVNYALDGSFNPWVYWMIECGENRTPKAAFSRAAKSYPKLAPYLDGVYEFDVCRQLRRDGIVRYSALKVGVLEHETLILAGNLDPITPVEWANEFHKENFNAQIWTLPNVGHAVTANTVCVHAQLEVFLGGEDTWQPKDLCSGELKSGIKKAP